MEFKYRIEQDEYHSDSPRDWDNLGIMVCWHTRYDLGDEQTLRLGDWLSNLLDTFGITRIGRNGYITEQWNDFIYELENDNPESINKAWDLLSDKILLLPLYLYDHSGLSMSTRYTYPHNDRWDAGQVGFIYVSIQDVKNEWGWKKLTSKRREQVFNSLRQEVETYDQYLRGDVWGYIIEDDSGYQYDSCWGFYGYDYCEKEAQAALEWQIKEHANLNEFERVI